MYLKKLVLNVMIVLYIMNIRRCNKNGTQPFFVTNNTVLNLFLSTSKYTISVPKTGYVTLHLREFTRIFHGHPVENPWYGQMLSYRIASWNKKKTDRI
jgi:hypothetical protein